MTTEVKMEAPRMLRVLCVDGDSAFSSRLSREFVGLCVPIQFEHRCDAQQALDHLSHAVVDVVMSGSSEKGIKSPSLLQEIQSQYPSALRFLIVGDRKSEALSQPASIAHQSVSSDISARELYKTLQASMAQLGKIRDERVTRALARLEKLPNRSAMMSDFLQLLSGQTPSVEAICSTVSRHPGMVARVLKIANSPLFGQAGRIQSLDDGIGILGLDMIASLFFSMQLVTMDAPPRESRLNAESLWMHSVQVAAILRRIGTHIKAPASSIREAATAALLHDVGKVVIAHAMPHEFAAASVLAMADRIPLWQAEKRVVGNSHAEVGACLLRLWGFPNSLVELIGAHHAPHKLGEGVNKAVLLLHLSDAVAHAQDGNGVATFLDASYLESADLPTDLPHWLSVAQPN